MVEQPLRGKRQNNAVFITCFYDIVIADRAAGLGNVLHAAFMGAFNVVSEGKEGI